MATDKPTIDSNVTGLALAEEESYRVPKRTNSIFRPLEPNSYDNFGANNEMTSRNPINKSRQNQKGRVTNVTAQVGVTQDLTEGIAFFLQGFVYADAHVKTGTMNPFKDTVTPTVAINSVDNSTVTFSSDRHGFRAGDIIHLPNLRATKFTGVVDLVEGAAVTVSDVADGSNLGSVNNVPTGAYALKVGQRFSSGAISVEYNSGLPRLVGPLGSLGVVPGEWIHIGGESQDTRFDETADRGFARVQEVTENYLVLDKTDAEYVETDGSGVTLDIYVGTMIRNEKSRDLIKQRSYVAERTYGDAGGEFVFGCRANQLQITVPTTGKVTTQLTFVAASSEVYESTTDSNYIKGKRLELERLPMFSAATDFHRQRLSVIDPQNSNPMPFVAHVSEMQTSIDNGVSVQNKIGTLGGFSTSSSNFTVNGSVTAYFTDIAAVRAVRQNADVTLDYAMIAENAGYLIDLPQVSLGNGSLNVQQDEPIMLPLDTSASEGKFGNTLTCMHFAYLPELL